MRWHFLYASNEFKQVNDELKLRLTGWDYGCTPSIDFWHYSTSHSWLACIECTALDRLQIYHYIYIDPTYGDIRSNMKSMDRCESGYISRPMRVLISQVNCITSQINTQPIYVL